MKKEIIKQLLAVEKEQTRRKNSALERYNKEVVHIKQMQFHRNMSQNRWVFGGNRTGKTECGAVEAVWLVRGIHPYRHNKDNVCGFVVSLSSQVSRDVAQAKILKYLEPRFIADVVMTQGRRDNAEGGVIDYILVKNAFGGTSKLCFRSCEQGREKFQGVGLDFVWFDEEPPKDIYAECKMRLLDKQGIIFGTMTPLKGMTWVYYDIYLNERCDKGVWYSFFEWADNPHLDQAQIEYFTSTFSSEELTSRRYGKFAFHSGLVYPEFDPSVHVIEPFEVPCEWYDGISIDPGLNNPLSCHWYAVDGDGVVYVIAEHYEAKRDISYHAKHILHICDQLNWQRDGRNRVRAIIDSASVQRTLSAEKSVAEIFCEMGILVNTKVDKSLFTGINRVKAYLKPSSGSPRLYIFSSCVNLIRELKGYCWGREDRPIKVEDHALDELRYYLAQRPQPHEDRVCNKSVIAQDKERLIRLGRRHTRKMR